jgi:hypothetical protein
LRTRKAHLRCNFQINDIVIGDYSTSQPVFVIGARQVFIAGNFLLQPAAPIILAGYLGQNVSNLSDLSSISLLGSLIIPPGETGRIIAARTILESFLDFREPSVLSLNGPGYFKRTNSGFSISGVNGITADTTAIVDVPNVILVDGAYVS